MNWTKNDGYITAESGPWSFEISRTYSCPPRAIPKAQRWTLTANGPWYLCRCLPRQCDCYAAAERVLIAAAILEGESNG